MINNWLSTGIDKSLEDLVGDTEHGTLAKPTQASRKDIDEKIISLVHNFYQDDEFSRLLPGFKDFVSIGYKVHQQKHLLLMQSRRVIC